MFRRYFLVMHGNKATKAGIKDRLISKKLIKPKQCINLRIDLTTARIIAIQ